MFPPQQPKSGAQYVAKEGLWLHTVFPAPFPHHSQQQALLEQWFEGELQRIATKAEVRVSKDGNGLISIPSFLASLSTETIEEEVLPATDICFHELLRQVSTSSKPRAAVMAEVWDLYSSLLKEVIHVSAKDVEVFDQQKDALVSENEALRVRIKAEEKRMGELMVSHGKLEDRVGRLQEDVAQKVLTVKTQRRLAEGVRTRATSLIRDLERAGSTAAGAQHFLTNPAHLLDDLHEILQEESLVKVQVKRGPESRRMSLLGLVPTFADTSDDEGVFESADTQGKLGGFSDADEANEAEEDGVGEGELQQQQVTGLESLLSQLNSNEFQGILTELARSLMSTGTEGVSADSLAHLAVVEGDLRAVKLQLEKLKRLRPRLVEMATQCDGVHISPPLTSATEGSAAISTALAIRAVPQAQSSGSQTDSAAGSPRGGGRAMGTQTRDNGRSVDVILKTAQLPPAIHTLLQGVRPSYVPEIYSLLDLHRRISEAYKAKIEADKLRDAEQAQRQTMLEAVVDMLMASAATLAEASEELCDLVASVLERKDESNAIKTFSRFLQFGDALDESSLNLHLELLAALQDLPHDRAGFESSEGLNWVNMEDVSESISLVLHRHLAPLPARDLMRVFDDSCSRQTGGSIICVSDLSALALTAWAEEKERNEAALRNVFLGGDINNDGELSFDEFASIVRRVERGRSTPEISQMYRETLHHAEVNQADAAEAFVRVAQAHRLIVWDFGSAWKRRHGSMAAVGATDIDSDDPEAVKTRSMMFKLLGKWKRLQSGVARLVDRAEKELDPAEHAEHADRFAHFLELLDQGSPGPASEALQLMLAELRTSFPNASFDDDTDDEESEGEESLSDSGSDGQ